MVRELSSVATFLGPKSMCGGILGSRSVWCAYGFSPEGHGKKTSHLEYLPLADG